MTETQRASRGAGHIWIGAFNNMAREEFAKNVIEKLRARVSNRCSNPCCRVPTTAAASDEGKVNSIGVAAHICAASPGGPRFSPEMTTGERKAIRNAIWLCSNCSIEIDRDEDKYPVDLLNEWKTKAEETAKKELGKKLPHNDDAINTVTAALCGISKEYIAAAIPNIHQATSRVLEELDSRFTIKSSYLDSQTVIKIFANEDVTFSMNIRAEHTNEYIEKYNKLIDHGDDLEISTGAISFEGSKLLDEITRKSDHGKMIISPIKKAGIQKIWLVNKENAQVEYFEDIRGEISVGKKSFKFEGVACDGIFTFAYRKEFDKRDATITFGIDFTIWEGRDIRHLPYFNKLFSLYENLSSGWRFFTALEVDGLRILDSDAIDASNIGFVNSIRLILNYIEKATVISEHFGTEIRFKPGFTYNHEDYRRLVEAAEIIMGNRVYTEKEAANVKCTVVVDQAGKNIDRFKKISKPTLFRITGIQNDPIDCFGVNIALPETIITLISVTPKIVSPKKRYKQGDTVAIVFVPSNGYTCTVEYA